MSNQQPYGPPPRQAPYQAPPQQYGGPPYGGQPFGDQQFGRPQYGTQQYGQQFGGQPQGGQPGFGWGPQFPTGPGRFRQPPRKKGRAAWVVVPIVVVLAGVIGLWTLGVIAKHNRQNDHVTQPFRTSSPYSPGPQSTPTDEPEPTTKPTGSKPTAPTKTTPPPPRQPTPSEVVTRDSFYFTGLQRTVRCRESSARASSIKGAAAYYGQIKACLDRAWPRQIRLAKDQFRAPRLIAMSGPMQTPCSGGAPSSFYCSVNDTIYMDASGDLRAYQKYNAYPNRTQALTFLRMDMADTVAHEYGHHLQNLSGILKASNTLEYEKSGDAALEMSRRLELQASCLGNVFLGVNKSTYPIRGAAKNELDFLHSHQGDEYGPQRDHGSRQVVPFWTSRGWNSHNNALCNTYTASSRQVR